jgi:hypothetical protein
MPNHGLLVGVPALALVLVLGGEDGPVLFDLVVVACFRQSLAFWCRPWAAAGMACQLRMVLGQEWWCHFTRPCAMAAHSVKASGVGP